MKMYLKIPKNRQDIGLCRLLSLFKQSANDVGLSHETYRSENRSLDLGSMSYLYRTSLRVFKKGRFRFLRPDIVHYNYFRQNSHFDIDSSIYCNALEYRGIKLETPNQPFAEWETLETVEPRFYSISEIKNQSLRNFIGRFYDLLLGEK
jgi:hypothetical protein